MSNRTPPRRFVESLQRPKEVGQSEYTILHGLLDDIADDPETTLEHLDTVLQEVAEWANALRQQLRGYRRRRKLARIYDDD